MRCTTSLSALWFIIPLYDQKDEVLRVLWNLVCLPWFIFQWEVWIREGFQIAGNFHLRHLIRMICEQIFALDKIDLKKSKAWILPCSYFHLTGCLTVLQGFSGDREMLGKAEQVWTLLPQHFQSSFIPFYSLKTHQDMQGDWYKVLYPEIWWNAMCSFFLKWWGYLEWRRS